MLEIDGLCAGYSTVAVLKAVSISVGDGAFVSVVGPNGAGKTTLFKTISGVLAPTAGSIRFEGQDLLRIAASRRPHLGLAHVPEGRHVFASLTVMENLELGAYTEAGRRRCAGKGKGLCGLRFGHTDLSPRQLKGKASPDPGPRGRGGSC